MSAEEQIDRIAMWLGLSAQERWLLIADGVRPSTVTVDAVVRVRRHLRQVFVAEVMQ